MSESEPIANSPSITFEAALDEAITIADQDDRTITFAFPVTGAPEPWAVRMNAYMQGQSAEVTTVGTGRDNTAEAAAQKVTSWRNVTVPLLCSAFAARATAPEQLAAVTSRLLGWASQRNFKGNQISATVDVLLHKGLELETQGGPSATEYFQTAGPNDPSTDVARKNLDVAFNRLLTKNPKGIAPEHLAKALAEFDAAGLIPDRFWSLFSLNASVACPQVLPLLHQKVTSPGAAKIWEDVDTVAVAETYMASILARYAEEPTRNRAHAAKLLQLTRPNAQPGVQLNVLIDKSNGVVSGFNAIAAKAEDQPLYPIELLDPKQPTRNAASAFLRALYVTRDPHASDEVKLAQHVQDERYAGVVAFLCERHASSDHRIPRALASMILEHPRMTPDQAEDARQTMRTSGDFVAALSAIAQPEQRPA